MSEDAGEKKGFDPFELMTAVLLGLAAIGAAVASFQNGQWGGMQLQAFTESNAMTTKAAKEYNEKVSLMNADYAAVAQAKKLILEGLDAKETDQARDYQLASYFYTEQLSDEAYRALKLPKQEPEKPGGANPPTKAEIEEDLLSGLAEDALLASLDVELHDEDSKYDEELFSESDKMFADADAKFVVGRTANENGDKFSLAGVYYTVALFFAGLGLVFKTSIRWGFLALGAVILLATSGYMATLPWA